MLNSNMLLDAMSGIRAEYVAQAQTALGYISLKEKSRHRNIWRTILIAAIIAALLIGSAYAFNWFGLSSRLTPTEDPYGPLTGTEPPSELTQKAPSAGGWLATNGASGSAEARASMEWSRIQWELTRSMELNDERINTWWASLTQYAQEAQIYNCFDQQMLDRLLEISDEYGLSLHSERTHPMTMELFRKAAGIDQFLLSENAYFSCMYLYEDGSFRGEGQLELDGKAVIYSLNRSMPGVLAPYGDYIADPSAYQEWQTEIEGHALNLAVTESEYGSSGYVFMQNGRYFVTISFTTSGAKDAPVMLERDEVERLAACFDYSVLCTGQPDLSVINGLTAVEVKPKEGLFTIEDFLNTPEYLAGSAFQHAYCDWNDRQEHLGGFVKGQYMQFHYAPFPTGVDELDELLASLQQQYGLKMPTDAVYILGSKYIPAERMMGFNAYCTEPGERPEDIELGEASEEDYWCMMGMDSFLLSEESYPFALAKWDNGAWQGAFIYGSTSFELAYIPKGCFCPILRESLHPDAAGWAYDTVCGEQVYICLDGERVYPRFPRPVVLYETDSAYIVLSYDGSADGAKMQLFADSVDFSAFN